MSRCVHPVVYVSGPVTGMRDGNRPAFEEAAHALRASGCIARIPHDDVDPGTPWTPAMKLTLMAILAQADGLAMLEGWARSRGARLENTVALALGMPVMDVDGWIRRGTGGRR